MGVEVINGHGYGAIMKMARRGITIKFKEE